MNFARTTAYTIKDTRTGVCSGAWTEAAKDMADMNARLKNAAFRYQGLPECFKVIPVVY